ncbi:MAG: alpha/beta hydrolase-fold protein, partial [Bacteroidota bacterium]
MIYPKSIPDQSSFWWSGLIFMLSLFLMLSHSTRLAAQAGTINFGRAYTITSSILQEQRQLMVYTPPDYADSKDSCHVLYLLDAEWNFHFVASTVDKLMASGMMPPSIVVGIVNTNRSRDLTPAGNNDNPRRFGGAASFLSFITEELQPWVGEHFRTYPFNILAGHSFGGLFTVFSMMEAPEAFQAYIALSPSLGRNSEQQVKRAASFFEAKDPLSKSLYLAIGDEQGYTKLSTEKLDQVVQGSKPMSFRYKFDMLEDENHASITSIGFL